MDRPRDLLRARDHERVLDHRHRDADRVRLLKAVGAEQFRAHLAGDEDHRNRVHHCVADRRDQVRRARTAGGERHADLARGLCVALGRVPAAGLVAHEDVSQAAVYERVVGRQVGAAGEAEDDLHALRLQTFHHGIDRAHLIDLLPSARNRQKSQCTSGFSAHSAASKRTARNFARSFPADRPALKLKRPRVRHRSPGLMTPPTVMKTTDDRIGI